MGEWQEVLERIRRLNRAVSRLAGFQPDFTGIMVELAEELDGAFVAAVKPDAEVLAAAPAGARRFIEDLPQIVREEFNRGEAPLTTAEGEDLSLPKKFAVLCPILGGDERLGTLVINRDRRFSKEEEFFAEYAAALLGILMCRWKEDKLEDLVRQRTACQVALSSLSFSEQQALYHILQELNGFEGMIVTSKIAEEVGITRSIVVNGLRKLESAGLIESRSLGMKGTYIRILNELLPEELAKALGLQ